MIRSYQIPVHSNPGKQENIRYTATRFIQYVQHFVNKFFYLKTHNKWARCYFANRATDVAQT